MKMECDSYIGRIEFDSGEVWSHIPNSEWIKLMEILLPKSVYDRYFQTDYRGVISKKRYEAGKIHYKKICKIFRIKRR